MELNNHNGAVAQGDAAKETKNEKPVPNGAAKKESPKPEAAKPRLELVKDAKIDQPKAETPTIEAPRAAATPALSLEGKLRILEDLHRRSVQRLNLIARIGQLEAFQVALAQENDELEDNPYQGCRLTIEDDSHRKFVTTTPGLIRMVSQFIFDACHEKLAEIERAIVFPAA